MNKRKSNILRAVVLLVVWVALGISLVRVNFDICNYEGKQGAETLCETWNDIHNDNAQVYKLKYGAGIFKHTKDLPVYYVLEGDGYIAYAIINDGKIVVKDDMAKWFRSNGDTEVISDIVITKAE